MREAVGGGAVRGAVAGGAVRLVTLVAGRLAEVGLTGGRLALCN